VSFTCDPARVDELVEAVFREIERLRGEGPSDDLVARARAQLRRGREEALRENGFWLGRLVAAARTGEDPRDLLAYGARLDAVTPAAVREAARTYLTPERHVRVVLYPG
jgi:zinc protease